jgi:uncharacterized membrane protein
MSTPLSFHDERSDGRGPGGGDHHNGNHSNSRHNSGGASDNAGRLFFFLVVVAAVLGVIFSMVSSTDFIEHLDRQVHSIHCSFIPGAKAEVGDNGCRTVMMSPYSSVLRTSMWGGIPIALLSVAVFAYLVMRGLQLGLGKRTTKNEALFLVAATGLPLLMSVIFGTIAINELGAVCKMCVGVYASSTFAFIFAVLGWWKSSASNEPMPFGTYARWFAEGCMYVGVLVAFYVLFAPTAPKAIDGCGTLVQKDDPAGIFISMSKGSGTPALAVLDPLCPACKGFDERIRAGGIDQRVAMNTVLFPLDSTCNWMVKESLHPGACAVSEAMLCDKDQALKVLDWAFANQERLRTTAKTDEAAVRAEIEKTFPSVKGCLGTAKIKNHVNKSLRFAVANALPLLTPQLFIGDRRVCDEDTDLGLEFTVDQMLKQQSSTTSSR